MDTSLLVRGAKPTMAVAETNRSMSLITKATLGKIVARNQCTKNRTKKNYQKRLKTVESLMLPWLKEKGLAPLVLIDQHNSTTATALLWTKPLKLSPLKTFSLYNIVD